MTVSESVERQRRPGLGEVLSLNTLDTRRKSLMKTLVEGAPGLK